MAVTGKQHAGGGSGGDVFDVRVLAFAGASATTLQALQDLFGLDRAGAQRLLDSVPLVVRRAAPANEAQSFVDALRGIGAQVALERPANLNSPERPVPAGPARKPAPLPLPKPARPAPPVPVRLAPLPPPKAAPGKAPPPPPREADPLPRPIMRALTADLEFDFASPQASDGNAGDMRNSLRPQGSNNGGSRGRHEIDFSDEPDTGALELDIGGARAQPARSIVPRSSVSDRAAVVRAAIAERAASKIVSTPTPLRSEPQVTSDPRAEQFAARLSNPDIARSGPGPIARAAVVQKPSIDPKHSPAQLRKIAVLRVVGALGVVAAGIVFDSSIVYGNANLISVIAHAVAIYQLGIGLRGLTP